VILKPQDVVILLKLVTLGQQPWTYQRLAVELSISQSEVHAGVRRAAAARLMSDTTAASGRPVLAALKEFLIHGVRYAYPPEHGGLTRGMPTAYAAPPLNKVIVQPNEPPPVWPYAEGAVRGHAFAPLYPSVPKAAERDPKLYELLALVDAMRDGRARERDLAAAEFEARLGGSMTMTARTGKDSASDVRALHAPHADYVTQPASGEFNIARDQIAALCRKYGVKKLSLFGSAARNEMTAGSDIDLLVEFTAGSATSLWDMPEMQREFSALFNDRPVELVPREVLNNPFRRKAIEAELRLLYEA
jgi:predicted nucleotidyltransferase